MSIRNEIIELINKENFVGVKITESTNLYKDLHLDSLSFVNILLSIEKQYHITIEMSEMESCLLVGQLIKLVNTKVKGERL